MTNLASFTDLLDDEMDISQPFSLSASSFTNVDHQNVVNDVKVLNKGVNRPPKHTGERQGLRSIEEIDPKYRDVFSFQYFNNVQTKVIEGALYSDKSLVVCAPTGSGKTVIFEMAIVQLLMEMEEKNIDEDFKIIYMAPIKAICTERLTEWYPKFTKYNLSCIEVTGDTDVDFSQLKPYRIIITTPEKWDMLTRRWRDYRGMVEVIKLFLIDEVHILNDVTRGPVLEAVVSRMKTIQSSLQSTYRIEQLKKQIQGTFVDITQIDANAPKIRFVAVSATVSNPEDVAEWLRTTNKPAVVYKFGDECRPVKLKRVVEGYPCPVGTSVFKFDICLNYKLWPIIERYQNSKPTLIFCSTRKSVILTAEALSRERSVRCSEEQNAKLRALASNIKTKKIQSLILCGVGCHHAGLLYEERVNIERAFRNSDLPILITTTTLAMGVNLPAHLVIIKNTQQYVNGTYQEYSISTVLQMVGRAGRPQFDSEATAVIMTRQVNKAKYQALVEGCEPLQSYLHKRLAENLNSEVALGTVIDPAQCLQWVRSTFLFVRATRDPKMYLGLPKSAHIDLVTKKIEELCMIAVNSLESSGLLTKDEACCIQSTEAGRLLSVYYLDLETMKRIMKIKGDESLEQLLWVVCESHELSDMHLRVDERRCLNALNRNNMAATIRFPMKGKINTRQMKLNCIIQAVLGCLPIHEPSLNQEAIKIMRIADRICKCLLSYVTQQNALSTCPQNYQTVLNAIVLAKCMECQLWENSKYVSKQLNGIGPTYSHSLATAGKINFMLLEESHPRDLERIMNKNPPGGNVIRQQISLLPKYQLTIIPIDENSISIQLKLLNQMHLAENLDHLTAGVKHKSYIIIGDSENYLLKLASFIDKDLITIYNGEINYQTVRHHRFEHKIMAHCISSSFAGLDVHCEYQFQGLDLFHAKGVIPITPKDKTICKNKQTAITDTFKIRKRKNCELAETSTAENKKSNFAIIEQIKSFTQSNDRSHNVNKSDENKKNEFYCDFAVKELNDDQNITNFNKSKNEEGDELIKNILNKIESENFQIVKPNYSMTQKSAPVVSKHFSTVNMRRTFDSEAKATKSRCFNKAEKEKNNFNVIDKIQKKAINMNENDKEVTDEKSTFVNTVKNHIDEYLERAKQSKNVLKLLEIEPNKSLFEIKTDEKHNFRDKDCLQINDQNYYCTQKTIADTLNNNKNDKAISIYGNKNIEVFKLPKLQNKDQNINTTAKVSDINKTNIVPEDENKLIEKILNQFNVFEEGHSNNADTKCISSTTVNNNSISNYEEQNIFEDFFDLDEIQNEDKNDTITNIYSKNNEDDHKNDTTNDRDNFNASGHFETLSDQDNIENDTTKDCALQNIREKDFDDNVVTNNRTLSVNNVNPDDFFHNKVDLSNNKILSNNYSNSFNEYNKALVPMTSSSVCNTVYQSGVLCTNSTLQQVSQKVDVVSKIANMSSLSETINNDVTAQTNLNKHLDNKVPRIEYMKKFSCTKTQVNICTESTEANYCVISKVQIDLDIIKNKQKQSDLEKVTNKVEKEEEELPYISIDNNLNEHQKKTEYTKISAEVTGCDKDIIVLKALEQTNHIERNKGSLKRTQQDINENPHLSRLEDVCEENQTEQYPSPGSSQTAKDIFNKYKKNVSSKLSDTDTIICRSATTSNYNKNETFKRPFSIRDLDELHGENSQNSNIQHLELDVSQLKTKIPENIKEYTEINKSIENELITEPNFKHTRPTSFDDVPSQSDIEMNQETLNTKQLSENPQPLIKLDQVCEESQTVPEPYHTVKDILNKYKKIVSSKFCDYSTSISTDTIGYGTPSSSTNSNNTTNNKNKKFKRPFSIRDLDNAHRSNSQNNIIRPPIELDHSKLLAKISESIKNSTEINEQEPEVNEDLIEPDIEYTRHKNVDELESPDVPSPINSQSPCFTQTELANDDLNLSQYMFNPKSLLESFVQDDDILPPSQFRDEPKRDSPLSDTDLNDLSLENDDTMNLDDQFEKCDKISTASTEIETWTLSKDDETWSSICRSVTTEQNIPPVADSYLQTTPTRKLKLNHFKFSRKKCYRVRK